MRLARRSGADETPHPLLERREQLLAAGRPLLDLSDSNPTRHGLLDEATAYEAQRKFNALTNVLLEKFEPAPEPKAASDK